MEPDYTIYTIPGADPGSQYCKDHPEFPPVTFLDIEDDGYAYMECAAGHLIKEMT